MKGFFHFSRKVFRPLCNQNRENGFILPLALVFSFLLFSMLFHQIKLYQAETDLSEGREKAFVLHRLTQMAAVDIKNMLDATDNPDTIGSFSYDKGKAKYNIVADENGILTIGLTIVLSNGGKDFNYFDYDINNKIITRWEEGI